MNCLTFFEGKTLFNKLLDLRAKLDLRLTKLFPLLLSSFTPQLPVVNNLLQGKKDKTNFFSNSAAFKQLGLVDFKIWL